MIFVWLKDALLCLLVCATLANINKHKKNILVPICLILGLMLMGIDL